MIPRLAGIKNIRMVSAIRIFLCFHSHDWNCVRPDMANAKGKQIGRPQITTDSIPAISLRHNPSFRNGKLNVSEVAKVCDLSRTTAYKHIGLLLVIQLHQPISA